MTLILLISFVSGEVPPIHQYCFSSNVYEDNIGNYDMTLQNGNISLLTDNLPNNVNFGCLFDDGYSYMGNLTTSTDLLYTIAFSLCVKVNSSKGGIPFNWQYDSNSQAYPFFYTDNKVYKLH